MEKTLNFAIAVVNHMDFVSTAFIIIVFKLLFEVWFSAINDRLFIEIPFLSKDFITTVNHLK